MTTNRNPTPDFARLWWTLAHLASDSQLVVAMRLMGLGGLWAVPRGEAADMVREKSPAFTEAALSAVLTALKGRAPAQVMQAAVDPISDRARANRARLTQCGPRIRVAPLSGIPNQ